MRKTKFSSRDLEEYIHVCSSCHCLIRNEVYAKCLDCENYIMCIYCLANGKENERHSKEHEFILININENEIYEDNWTISEEIKLLFSLQFHGVDDWTRASKFVQTKTPEECYAHFLNVYANSPSAPLPSKIESNEKQEKPVLYPINEDDKPCPSLAAPEVLKSKRKSNCTSFGEWAGYMPQRDDYENDAYADSELKLNDLFFDKDYENEATFNQKLEILMNYSKFIDVRKDAHKFVEKEQIIDKNFGSGRTKYLPKDNLDNILLPCRKYLDSAQAKKIKEVLSREQEIIDEATFRNDIFQQGASSKISANFIQMENLGNEITEFQKNNVTKSLQRIETEMRVKNSLAREVLTQKEIQYCNLMNIDYSLFHEMKDKFVIESLKSDQPLTLEAASKMFPEESTNLVSIIANYLKQFGYIKFVGNA